MSLQLAAQHLSSQGRGNDSTLVHMSPREVKSLNDLAMAHGGQLSINPQTGLPEAGFLESILPMVAGAGLMAVSGGAINPMTAGLITGGLSYAMTGSLQKGLMAGLGAYGGANLGAGLAETAVTMDPNVVQAQTAAVENAKNLYDPTGTLSPEAYASTQQAANNTLAKNLVDARGVAAGPDTFMGNLQQMSKGIGSLGKEGGFSSLYQNLGGSPMSLISKLGPAAAPAIGEMMTPKKQEEEKADADMGQRYGFSMNPTGGQPQQPRQVQPGQNPLDNPQTPTTTPFPQPDPYGREQRYFAPSYSKLTPEEAKKMYGYADGGITGQGDLQLNIPLNLGGGGGSYGGGGNGGGTYPFQSSGGFAGNNNAPQATPNPRPLFNQGNQGQFAGPAQREIQAAEIKRLGQGQDVIKPATDRQDQLVGREDPFFQSPEFKEYQNNLGAETMDMYYSPIFGQMGSGSAGRAQEAAYRKYKGIAEPRENSFNPIKSDLQGGLGSPQGSFGGGLQGGLAGLFGRMQQGGNFNQQQFSSYADGGIADEDRPTETPAVKMFQQMQAQRAAQAQAPQVDANAQYADYLKQTMGTPNQMQAPTAPPPTSTGLGEYGYAFNPVKQQFSQIPGSAPVEDEEEKKKAAPFTYTGNQGGMGASAISRASGGSISHLGDYSDGGRLLRGPGDGVSDSIPAMIGKKQPARLADGEFVVPARIVSELGNGSTEAGARKLYAMMDRIQKARGKTVGKNKVAKNSRSEKYLPA